MNGPAAEKLPRKIMVCRQSVYPRRLNCGTVTRSLISGDRIAEIDEHARITRFDLPQADGSIEAS